MSAPEQMTDRELIIQQGSDIKHLCMIFEEFKKSNEAEHKEIFAKIDKISDGKISNRLFFWTIGFILLFIIGLTGYTGTIKNDVVKNTTCIEKLESQY